MLQINTLLHLNYYFSDLTHPGSIPANKQHLSGGLPLRLARIIHVPAM